MRSTWFGRHIQHGFVYFLTLLAFAMLQMASFYILLPLFFFAVAACVLPMREDKKGYLAIALTVCKNE